MNSIAFLILAAGTSSRMKEPKQLLKIKHKTLLEITLENAQKINTKNVFCVLGAHAQKIKQETTTKNINYIFNPNFKKGMSSSIVFGIKHIQKHHAHLNAVLILLADQPFIKPSFLNQLIAQYQKKTTTIIASDYGNAIGVPAIFPKEYFTMLQLLKGDKGAKVFLNTNKEKVISIKSDDLIDVDTQQDFKAYTHQK